MTEAIKVDEEAEGFTMEDLEERAERDLKMFKELVNQHFSEK